jgi:acetoin utilization protein AcuB
MLVGERMSKPVITIRPEVPVQEALSLMHKEHVRRFPVIDHHGRMIGLVSESDCLNASPSEATSLSVWELNYLISKITVERVMTRKIVTITEDVPLEEAARIMADNNIGSLPVMRGDSVIGIITETDLFKIFLELLGAREAGIRVTVLLDDQPGKLHALTGAIQSIGGNIVALGTFLGESAQNRMVTFKVSYVGMEQLKEAIAPFVERISDIRETKAT